MLLFSTTRAVGSSSSRVPRIAAGAFVRCVRASRSSWPYIVAMGSASLHFAVRWATICGFFFPVVLYSLPPPVVTITSWAFSPVSR